MQSTQMIGFQFLMVCAKKKSKQDLEFDNLVKQYQKGSAVVQQYGIPDFFISMLVQLEDHLKYTQENKTKIKMSATNAKSFNAMRQRIKKHNAAFETKMEEFRKVRSIENLTLP